MICEIKRSHFVQYNVIGSFVWGLVEGAKESETS